MHPPYDPTGQSDFENLGKAGVYRPSGETTAGQLADMMTFAIQHSLEERLRGVALNITRINGFEPPGPAYRRWLVSRWAELARSRLRVAVVARREHICPDKTGLLTAAEEGLGAS